MEWRNKHRQKSKSYHHGQKPPVQERDKSKNTEEKTTYVRADTAIAKCQFIKAQKQQGRVKKSNDTRTLKIEIKRRNENKRWI